MTLFSIPSWLWLWLFTNEEREIYNLILAIQSKSIWHVRINDFIQAPGYGRGIDLFIDLRVQCLETPENMKRLIGTDLVDKLLKWRP